MSFPDRRPIPNRRRMKELAAGGLGSERPEGSRLPRAYPAYRWVAGAWAQAYITCILQVSRAETSAMTRVNVAPQLRQLRWPHLED